MRQADNETGMERDLGQERGEIRIWLRREGRENPDFVPLGPPDAYDLDLEPLLRGGLDGLVDELELDAEVVLAAGNYRLPILADQPLKVEMPRDVLSRIHVAIGPLAAPKRGAGEETPGVGIQELDVQFDPEIRLPNVFDVLYRLPSLFMDHDVEAAKRLVFQLLQSDVAQNLVQVGQEWFSWLEESVDLMSPKAGKAAWSLLGLAEMVRSEVTRVGQQWRKRGLDFFEDIARFKERLPVIHLNRIRAEAVAEEDGGWHLDFRFSGRSHMPTGRSWKFDNRLLPHMILPAPHALISELISNKPLATAVVRQGAFSPRRLIESLVSAPLSLRGTVVGRGSLPSVEVGGQTPDLGEYRTRVRLGGRGRLEGRFDLRAGGGKLRIETLQVNYGKQNGRLGLSMTGAVTLHDAEPQHHEDPSQDGPWGQETTGERDGSVARSLLGRLVSAAFDRRWSEDLHFETGWKLETEGSLDDIEVGVHWSHQLLDGALQALVSFDDAGVFGELSLRGRGSPVQIEVGDAAGLTLEATGRLDHAAAKLGGLLVEPTMSDLSIQSKVGRAKGGGLSLVTSLSSALAVDVAYPLDLFPEFGIDDEREASFHGLGRLSGHLAVETSSLQGMEMTADFGGSTFQVDVARFDGDIAGRKLVFPDQSRLQVDLLEAKMATSGLGRASVQLGWDLAGNSPILVRGDDSVELFVDELRRGSLVMHVSEAGGVTFSGLEGGLYDFHFFNALVNPGDEPKRWLEILSDDEAMDRVEATVKLFSNEVASFLRAGRRQVRRIRDILDEEGIRRVADFVPADRMARVLSKVICGTDAERQTIETLVRGVVAGQGLDVPRIRSLIDRYYPEHEYDFEIERTLRILARLLAPTEPVPDMAPLEECPVAERKEYIEMFAQYLSADEVYERLSGTNSPDLEFWAKLGRQAPFLTIEQLDYIIEHLDETSPPEQVRRIRAVRALKERTRLVADAYGGIAFMPQAWAVGLFLGEAVRAGGVPVGGSARGNCKPVGRGRFELGSSLLGPADVAVLLHAGLASFWQGPAVQTNQRLLLDIVCSQPGEYLLGVLWEMAHRSARALSGVLYGLLQIEQDALVDKVDMPVLLSRILGIDVPRIDDYMAGGRRARQSLFEALNDTAKQILDAAEPYVALREFLHVQRHRVPRVTGVPESAEALVDRARKAIARADKKGAQCRFPDPDPKKEAAARGAYEKAFDACRNLIAVQPRAFHQDWFKEFFARNYEALMVRSVLRNHQQAIDAVPAWLERRLGTEVPVDEQALVDAVIDALYYFEDDRNKLKADPLVRLLLDPPQGRYDLTVISCMGVITEGAKGTELKDAYRRLEERYGIRVIRADTQTARTLEYNAARVEEAVRLVDGPWGYVGYSQGCANGLMAESRLLGGSPEQQELVSRLKTRHLLFSAINGSAHGTCGDWKFLRAMSDADRFLKFYQAVLSKSAIRFALKNLRALLDSKPFVHSLGGVASLSHEGVRALARDGQFRDDVPTTLLRGIVEAETTPEVLEMLSNWLTREVDSDQHDTQVTSWEAVGHPVWVLNDQSRLLERCDMGGLVQRTHHWSPLFYAVEFVTTDRDRALGVYDTPKDRHVFPWVEVNARFGIVDVIASNP